MRNYTLLFSMVGFLTSSSAWGATYYVAKTGMDSYSCTQAQSPTTPKLTIQAGVKCLKQAGDTVTVKAGTYAESVFIGTSGASGNPVVIQANTGDMVNVTGDPAFSADNVSYVRIQGFSFNGSGGGCQGTLGVIMFRNLTGDKTNHPVLGGEVINNTFTNCGSSNQLKNGGAGVGIRFMATGHDDNYKGGALDGGTVNGNTFSGFTGEDISANGASDLHIFNNTSTNNHSGYNPWTNAYSSKFYNGGGTSVNAFWTVPLRNLIENNTISNFIIDSYVGGDTLEADGVRLDSSASQHTIKNNIIHDIAYNGSWSFQNEGFGVYGEANSSNNIVRENVIYNISEAGVKWGSSKQRPALNNQVINNTIYKVTLNCITLDNAQGALVENNSLTECGRTQIAVCQQSVTLGGHVFKNNNYFKTGASLVNYWNMPCTTYPWFYNANQTLTQWNSASGETNSASTDPKFTSAPPDFHLLLTSPLRGAGFGGVSIGAYPIELIVPSSLQLAAH